MVAWYNSAHQVNIICLTDLLNFTTIADIAKVPCPTTYGALDGVSFYPYLFGQTGTPRRLGIFMSYNQNEEGEGLHPIQRWNK